MKFVADLHLHSKYSRAVSPQMNLENMAKWAKIKGIQVLGTADFTHPAWFSELKTKLTQKENGLYQISDDRYQMSDIYFLPSTELSSIYSQGGKLRRVHNVILAPSLEAVEKIIKELSKRNVNLASDGRPIMGISSHDLLEMLLGIDENIILIPAHAWTPWFSVFGSNSGFDSLGECFRDLEKYITAVETGLSSDPAMNWRVKELDSRQIVSFSDAHSMENMGREATVFEGEKISFDNIASALKGKNEKAANNFSTSNLAGPAGLHPAPTSSPPTATQLRAGAGARAGSPRPSPAKIAFTIEFFPEEGKYHFSGHRLCKVRQSPQEDVSGGTVCPLCGKPLTIGVSYRVEELAGRKEAELDLEKGEFIKSKAFSRPPYKNLVPLREIIAESLDLGKATKGVVLEYQKLISHFGSELGVLLKEDTSEISKISGEKIAEGVEKVRRGDLIIEPGYDGEYGIVKIWGEKAKKDRKKQMSLL